MGLSTSKALRLEKLPREALAHKKLGRIISNEQVFSRGGSTLHGSGCLESIGVGVYWMVWFHGETDRGMSGQAGT